MRAGVLLRDHLSVLPSDSLLAVCLHLASGVAFVRLRATSHAIRNALASPSTLALVWKAFLLKQFPRVQSLLARKPQLACELLYRQQLFAERQRATKTLVQLADLWFIFELADAGAKVAEWSGSFERIEDLLCPSLGSDPDDPDPDGVDYDHEPSDRAPCLWFDAWPSLIPRPEHGIPPQHADAAWRAPGTLADWEHIRNVRLTVYVTDVNTGRTVSFYRAALGADGSEQATIFADETVHPSKSMIGEGLGDASVLRMLSCSAVFHDPTGKVSLAFRIGFRNASGGLLNFGPPCDAAEVQAYFQGLSFMDA